MCCTDFARFHAWLKLCRAYALFLRPLPEQAPLPPWLIAGRHSRGALASINRHEGNSPASNINTETGCAATEARPELVRAPQALRVPQRRLFNTQILLEEIWPRISLGCLICHEPRPVLHGLDKYLSLCQTQICTNWVSPGSEFYMSVFIYTHFVSLNLTKGFRFVRVSSWILCGLPFFMTAWNAQYHRALSSVKH